MDHNNDAIHSDLKAYGQSTQFDFLRQLLGAPERKLRRMGSQGKLTGKMTVASKAQKEMAKLSQRLNFAGVHFVRCIKTNDEGKNAFDPTLVLSQLKHLGISETCKIRQMGFPVRRGVDELLAQFGDLLSEEMRVGEGIHDQGRAERAMVSILEAVLGTWP